MPAGLAGTGAFSIRRKSNQTATATRFEQNLITHRDEN
jgi:hypothetical protein